MGEGARALLFERLVDEDPRAATELRPLRTHDRAGLRASVLRRLILLLNTRAPRLRPVSGALTVLDFGLPDHSALYSRDPEAHRALALEIRRTIRSFEPRLEVAEVLVAPGSDPDRSVQVRIRGRIRDEEVTEPVAFSIDLGGTAGGGTA